MFELCLPVIMLGIDVDTFVLKQDYTNTYIRWQIMKYIWLTMTDTAYTLNFTFSSESQVVLII